MKRNSNNPIDGVSKRPRRRRIGDFNDVRSLHGRADELKKTPEERPIIESDPRKVSLKETEADLDFKAESTRSPSDQPKKRFSAFKAKRRSKKMAKKQKLAKMHPFWRGLRRIGSVTGLAVLLIGVFLAVQAWWAFQSVIDRAGDGAVALQDNVDPSTLNGEGDGRVNILLIGEGGEEHDGGNRISDSIIIASIDPFAHEVAMLSLPRDMEVPIPDYWTTKINAAHALGESTDYQKEGFPEGGPGLLIETIENVLDQPIHYYVRVDFDGWKQAVDAVGGITINLDEPIYDNNFDWEYGRDALRLPAGENYLNGTTALLLARARGAGSASYGLSNSDFDRTENQRKMLLALKDKILSLGTLSNPGRISSLIGAAGSHVKTNLQISEMLRIYEIVEQVSEDKILSYGIDNTNYLVASGSGNGNFVPRDGTYQEIKEFVRSIFIDGFIKKENATIDVLNGTEIAGVASEKAAELESYGYNVFNIGDAPGDVVAQSSIYDLSQGEAPFTKRLLEQRFGISAKPADELPPGIITTSQFVIIVGTNGTTN